MKTIKNIILFFIVALLPMIGMAQEENNDAVYNKLTKEYVLNADGSMEFHLHKELKLLTHFAFHRLFGETFIIYDPTYQELKINESYTIMADGKKVSAPGNAFNEVLPGFARNIPTYNHLREMVVTHTGLEVGATIVLDYTIVTKNPFIPYLMGDEAIVENVPVKEMQVKVKVPADMELTYKMLNLRTAPEIVKGGKESLYTWTFKGLNAQSMESYQVPAQAPRLLFSTAKDFQQAYFKFVDQMAFRSMASSKAKKSIKELLDANDDDLAKMMKLQDLVLNEVSLANIPMEYTGFKVREPADTWQQTNATPLEKAILLSDMLIQANINAIPVALVPNNEYDKALGNLLTFEQFMVQVNPKDMDRFYLSVTGKQDQNLLYDISEYTIIQLDGAIESVRTFNEAAAKDNSMSLSGKLSLDEKVLKGKVTVALNGDKNPYLKLQGNADAIKGMIPGGSSAVKSYESKKMGALVSETDMVIEKEEPLESLGGYYFLSLPSLAGGLAGMHLEGMSDVRETAMKLPHGTSEKYELELDLPDGWKLITPAVKLDMQTKVGNLKMDIRQKKNTLIIKKEVSLNPDIELKNYQDFLHLVRTWTDERYNKLVLVGGTGQ